MARGVTTSVKAYGGEVESLTSAESSGVGIRVIARPPPGLRPRRHARRRRRSPRRSPRPATTPRSASPTSSTGWPQPDGVGRGRPGPVARRAGARFAAERKVELALELERAGLGRDPRVTGRAHRGLRRLRRARRRSPSTAGIARQLAGHVLQPVGVGAGRATAARPRSAAASTSAATRPSSTSSVAAADAVERAAACSAPPGAVAAAHRRARAPAGGDDPRASSAARSPASGC